MTAQGRPTLEGLLLVETRLKIGAKKVEKLGKSCTIPLGIIAYYGESNEFCGGLSTEAVLAGRLEALSGPLDE